MNLNNIQINKKHKYKELIYTLDLPFKNTGNPRKTQIKEINRFCTLRKEGHSYWIESIKDYPDFLEDKNGDIISKNLMMKLILDIMKEYIKRRQIENEHGWIVSALQLSHLIGVINDNYMFGRSDIKRISERLKVNEIIVRDTVHSINKTIKSRCDTALGALSKSGFIFHKRIIAIKENNNPETREATDEEYDFIIDAESDYLRENDLPHRGIVYLMGQTKIREMYKQIEQKLHKEYGNSIEYYYRAYKIYGTNNSISYGQSVIEKRVIKEIRKQLNNHIKLQEYQKAFIRELDSEKRKQLGHLTFDSETNIKNKYVKDSHKTIDHFIDEKGE